MNDSMVLVTGATGFVGGHVVREALRGGARVRALIRCPTQAADLETLDVQTVVGDVRDEEALRKAVDGVDGIYHVAALFRQAGLPDSEYRDVNAGGTRKLFERAAGAKVGRIIHCSTGGVLGDVCNIPADEDTPLNPGDIYQQTKLEGEGIALDYYRSGRMGGVVIRPGMVYGPGDTRNLKLFRMIARRTFFYVGRGDNLVHFVDVRDIARAFCLAMQKEDINGTTYHIAGKRYMTLREFAKLVAEELGVPPPRLCVPVKPMQWLGSCCEALCRPLGIAPPLYRRRVDFYTKNRAFDTTRARRDLGYEPALEPQEEIREIIRDYRDRQWI